MKINPNDFLGTSIQANDQEYKIVEYIKSGAVGHMFRGRNDVLQEDRAIKFIPKSALKPDWQNEIRKAVRLRHQGNVVYYYTHSKCMIKNEEYLYIMWDYIQNETLEAMINDNTITITLLQDVIITLLHVFHACKNAGIIHADLHSGNILIGKEEGLNIDKKYRKIWVTDFSRVTNQNNIEHMDDYLGFVNIIKKSLRAIDFHALDSEGRHIFDVIQNKFIKNLHETNIMIDGSARNPDILLERFRKLITSMGNKDMVANPEMNDYLAAEHLGDNFEEWKALFVPKFIAINELLEKNICVLTGLRGCGKTMLFKRLSSYYNIMMGGAADLVGSDSFYGFYLNARDIAETFPWLPEDKEEEAGHQLIHNFNLRWTLEILIWLRELTRINNYDLTFLNNFFSGYFPEYYSVGADRNIYYQIDLIKTELEKSRLNSRYHSENWTLIQYDYLENFVTLLKEKMPLERNKPFFFFLDDYSLPMVKSTIQRILNPIIFRRSANIIFKVSTESVEGFLKIGLNQKPLEENDDYTLIDCGKLVILRNEKVSKEIIFEIMNKRIERYHILRGRNLTIDKMLGKTKFDDEQRALLIKNQTTNVESSKYLYQGWKVFYKMWTSDIREMINIFAEMVSLEEDLEKKNYLISDKIQDKIYKDSGGQFVNLLGSATNPSERSLTKEDSENYGKHLSEILEAFHQIASFEIRNKYSKNLDKKPIKKARRIEILNSDQSLDGAAIDYYNGLIRYGIFIQDNRGKSVRGKIAPRLFLRSLLIPFFRLAFSKRDSITMSCDDIKQWLLNPLEFAEEYKKKNSNSENISNKECQPELFEES